MEDDGLGDHHKSLYAPIMTEEVGAKSQRNLGSTLLFNNGKGTKRESETTTKSVAE